MKAASEWKVKYTWAFRLMYIAESLINPLFTDVAFHRDSEGDGSGHYESGGVMSPPPVPSAICVPGPKPCLCAKERTCHESGLRTSATTLLLHLTSDNSSHHPLH